MDNYPISRSLYARLSAVQFSPGVWTFSVDFRPRVRRAELLVTTTAPIAPGHYISMSYGVLSGG